MMKYAITCQSMEYNVIEIDHFAIGHGGCNRLCKEAGKKYTNITLPMMN